MIQNKYCFLTELIDTTKYCIRRIIIVESIVLLCSVYENMKMSQEIEIMFNDIKRRMTKEIASSCNFKK